MAEAGRAALWSPEALDDRERIWDYYVRVAGKHTAEKMLREIAEARQARACMMGLYFAARDGSGSPITWESLFRTRCRRIFRHPQPVRL
jgi:plasmid stabilization system protein ParE